MAGVERQRLGTSWAGHFSKNGISREQLPLMSMRFRCNPTTTPYRRDYALMLIETRQADAAIVELEKILQHDPNNSEAWVNIGYAHLKQGKHEQAAADFRKALARDPNSPAAHYDLGIALKMTDQIEAAQKELEQAIRLDPSLPEAHYTLGDYRLATR